MGLLIQDSQQHQKHLTFLELTCSQDLHADNVFTGWLKGQSPAEITGAVSPVIWNHIVLMESQLGLESLLQDYWGQYKGTLTSRQEIFTVSKAQNMRSLQELTLPRQSARKGLGHSP